MSSRRKAADLGRLTVSAEIIRTEAEILEGQWTGLGLRLPPMSAWVLVLAPTTGDPLRRVGGLALVLRLVLDAQAAGARGYVLKGASTGFLEVLADPRVRIPRLSQADAEDVSIAVPWTWLMPRDILRTVQNQGLGADTTLQLVHAVPAISGPYGFAPVDVLDRPSARRAEGLLFRSLRKTEDGWTSRWLNRYISLTVSRWLVKTPLRPNQLSVAILGVGIAGAYLASRGTYGSLVLGACLFQAQSVLDGCDGEMSRVTHRGSHLGEWLDTIGDDITNYGFFAGAGYGLWHSTGHPIYLVSAGVTLLAGLIASGLEYRYLLKIGSGDLLRYPLSQQTNSGTGPFAAITPLFKRDTFVLLTLLAAVANLLGIAMALFAIAAVGILITVVSTELRLARESRRRSA